jgi:hypothetical protein
MRPEDVAKLRSEEPRDLWPEIERRLSLPAPRAHRARRRVAAVVAAAVLAVVFSLALFGLTRMLRQRPVLIGAGDIARISVPEPQPLVAGEGAVWVVGARSNEGELWRIDPATNQAQPVPGTEGAWWPAAGEGAAWVTTCHRNDQTDCAEADLLRIDPSLGAVTSSFTLPGPPVAIAAGLGSVWVSSNERLLKIHPRSMSLVGSFSIHTDLLGIADGYLWATIEGSGVPGVAKIDPATGRIVAQVPFHDPCTFGASDQLVIVASCQGGRPYGTGPDRLAGIDPATAEVQFDVPLSSYGDLAFTDGHPWIAAWTDSPERVRVQQLDPSTGRPTDVSASVRPGPEPWIEIGFGAPSVFIAVSGDSFWLTHVDAKDVVRVRIPK